MTTDAVCQRVGISRWTLGRWIEQGKFPRPTDWPGHERRWLKSDVEAFLRRAITKARKDSQVS